MPVGGYYEAMRHCQKILAERYEREIAEGKRERLNPKLEDAIKEFRDAIAGEPPKEK